MTEPTDTAYDTPISPISRGEVPWFIPSQVFNERTEGFTTVVRWGWKGPWLVEVRGPDHTVIDSWRVTQ